MLRSGTSGIDHTQHSIQLCIGLLLKDSYFSRSLSPSLAFTSLMLSPLALGVKEMQGNDFCPGFITASKAAGIGISLFSRLSLKLQPCSCGMPYRNGVKLNL